MAGKKSATIGGRIDGELRERLDRITRRFAVTDAAMLDDALTALADYVESRGRYERPMAMIFDEERSSLLAAAAEDPPPKIRGKPPKQPPGPAHEKAG
ncbi:MAG TPA: hypothetical protein VHF69_12410 [Candidatus Synoicihabitans sp.]|nr:hypothetical protein [Candidatus Synoicihabitans sp.]